MSNFPFKAGGVPKPPKVKGRDAVKVKNQTPPRNKSIVPKKPEAKNQATPKQGGQGGKGGRLERTARRLTNGVVRDEMRGLKSQRREVNRAARHAQLETRNQYRRGLEDLDYVAQETGDYVNYANQQGQEAFNTQGVVQNAAAAALQAQLGNIYAAGEGSATAEMARLGLTGAQGFLDEMASGKAFSQGQAAQLSADNAANLGLAQANSGAVGNLLSGMVQGSYLSGVGQNLNARNESMNQTRADQADQLSLVRDAITDAQKGRKDTFFQLLTQLQQTGWAGGNGKGKKGSRPPAKPKDGEEVKVPKKEPEKPKPKPPKAKKPPTKGKGR